MSSHKIGRIWKCGCAVCISQLEGGTVHAVEDVKRVALSSSDPPVNHPGVRVHDNPPNRTRTHLLDELQEICDQAM